jgi:outer membrane receptor for ferrienterochelin and colicins
MLRKLLVSAGVAALPLAPAYAFAEDAEIIETREVSTVEEVVVNGELVFRNRTTDVNPVLSYDLEFFQRFEPVSVGEMLKRVPGVTFTSDVLEFDGVSMRGMAPGYTQILINGRRAPGGEGDRSFFVDRIPAELVERIEIIRSPRADQPSDGIAGSLNVVLKEGASLEGGFAKAGVLVNADGVARPSAAVAHAGQAGDTSWWAALNYQGRRNPKKKVSHRYNGDGELDNIAYESDTRDGVDISANGELTHRFDGGRIRLSGLAVNTDRDEDETETEVVDNGSGVFDQLDAVAIQRERISQQTYELSADGKFDVGPGELDLNLGWAGYREDTTTDVDEGDDFGELELDEHTKLKIKDDEYGTGLAYTLKSDKVRFKAGVDLLRKERDGAEIEYDIDDGVVGDPDPAPGAVYAIRETRIDPFARLTLTPNEMWSIDLGLRYETTDREISSDNGAVSFDAQELNPSAHVTFRPTAADQFRFSVARTVRRPDYDLLAPYTAEEEPSDDDDLAGNPLLKRLGRRGVFGVNLFWRDVSDKIAVVSTGQTSSSGDGSIYSPQNIGDGKVWGVEVDFSAPLDVIKLPDTGLFFNYTWMDSEVSDPYTGQKLRFANQPSNVFNVGFIHTVRAWDMSFGASYYQRDKGYESQLDEFGSVDYDGDLEAFVEKRFGKSWVVRVAAMNLLDKEKREHYLKYDGDSVQEILDNRRNGVIDEIEDESERSGVLYQFTVRAAF